MLDLLEIHRKSFEPISANLKRLLKTQGYSPTADNPDPYPGIISTLNIFYKNRFSSVEDLAESVTDGGDDGGFDAIVFESNSINIFEFKISPGLGQKDLMYFATRFENNFIRKPEPLTDSTSRRLGPALETWWRKKKPEINIYFVRPNFGPKLEHRVQLEIRKLEKHAGVKVYLVDDEQLLAKLIEEDYLETWELSTDDLVEMLRHPKNGTIKHLIVKVPVNSILDLYHKHLCVNKNLFARNVRIPKTNFDFSESISSSLDNEPENFHLLHNGLVLVANSVRATHANSYTITSPQIVNGAQSIGSLYKVYSQRLNHKKLKRAHFVCKILVTTDTEQIQKICEATNTQRPVVVEELRTNDTFQKNLEVYIRSASLGKYQYVRKKGAEIKTGVSVEYVKFFQWAYSAFLEKPAEAKNARKNLFSESDRGRYRTLMESIELNEDNIVLLCDVAFAVERYIKNEDEKSKKSLMRSMNLHIIAALYHLNSFEEKHFNYCFKVLYKYYRELQKLDANITPNKVFTKSEGAWIHLKKHLKI